MQTISRIAPTPSGYLHLGNAANFLLTWLAVQLRGGRLLLRIDDLDRDRCKPLYVDDIFRTLEWLGIEPDGGPSGSDDFYKHHSQSLRYDLYRNALGQMSEQGAHLFACTCTRKELSGHPRYPGTCREAGLEAVAKQTAIRIAVPEKSDIAVGDRTVALDRTMGDFILWRRDDLPAYQLVSVVEDRRSGVNLLIRGNDLLGSSAAQRFIAPFLHADTFEQATFFHHELVLREDGSKFSKSDRDLSLERIRKTMTDTGARHLVFEQVQRIVGLRVSPMQTPRQLLQKCQAIDPQSLHAYGPFLRTFLTGGP